MHFNREIFFDFRRAQQCRLELWIGQNNMIFAAVPLKKVKLTTSLKPSLTPECSITTLVHRGKCITITALNMTALFFPMGLSPRHWTVMVAMVVAIHRPLCSLHGSKNHAATELPSMCCFGHKLGSAG